MRCAGEIGLEKALELQEGLVVEHDRVEVGEAEVREFQAEPHGLRREGRVVTLAREALFLCGGHDPSVDDQSRGSVVIICGNP